MIKVSAKLLELPQLSRKLSKLKDNNDWAKFIDCYEAHLDLITGANDIEFIMLINADYANALVYDERHRQALPVLNSSIEWHRQESAHESTNVILDTLNYNLGVAHFNLGAMKMAKTQFKWLLQQHPENKTYNAWLAACDTERLQKTQKAVIFISLGALAASVFDIQEQINWLFEGIVIIGVMLILFNVYLIRKNKKAVLMK